jgi:hypothetical protein
MRISINRRPSTPVAGGHNGRAQEIRYENRVYWCR